MRFLQVAGLLLLASLGCKVSTLPIGAAPDSGVSGSDGGNTGDGDPGAGNPAACVLDGGVRGGEADGWLTDPTSPTGRPCSCDQPDGPVLPLPTLATARALFPGRWLSCYRSADAIGPWTPTRFVGIELIADDSVTPAAAGGGRWYFLESAPDGTIQRGQGFDAQGTFLYNPFPGPDWEQVHLSASGQYADFTVAFSDGPRKMRMLGPASFTGIFVPVGQ